jgi:hypothetical protein
MQDVLSRYLTRFYSSAYRQLGNIWSKLDLTVSQCQASNNPSLCRWTAIAPRSRLRKPDPAGFHRQAANSLYTDTAISLSTLGQSVLLHISNLTIFENLDLAPWRRLESRMRLFELTSPPKSDGPKEEVPQIHLDSRNHVP